MSDFIPISDLSERTAAVNSDIMHIRSTGGIDSKISVTNFLKSVLDSIRALITGTIITATTKIVTDIIEENISDAGVTIDEVLLKDGGATFINLVKWKKYYKADTELGPIVFAILATWVPTTGYSLSCVGQLSAISRTGSIFAIERTSSTTIELYYYRVDIPGTSQLTINSTGTTPYRIEIMSNFDETTNDVI